MVKLQVKTNLKTDKNWAFSCR